MTTFVPPPLAIGLDIGGTKLAGGVVTSDGTVLERVRNVPTPGQGGDRFVSVLTRAIEDLRSRHPEVAAIGVGAAGLVSWPSGYLNWAPHNPYRDLPLRDVLEETTGLPTAVDNDANTAAWAEYRLGTGCPDFAMITVGTGLGGAVILDGELRRGHHGFASEIGHIIVDPASSIRCACGHLGCLETVASGSALGRRGRQAAAADPGGMLATLANGSANVTGETVWAAAQAGDEVALSLFGIIGRWLGIGSATLASLFDVDRIVIGGGVAATGDLLLEPTRASLGQHLFGAAHRPPVDIVPASLGPDAGWIGSGLLALDTMCLEEPPRRVDQRDPAAAV
jgi:glucokinase